jgi:hypothetical protein
VLSALDLKTAAALTKNPNNPAALSKGLAEIAKFKGASAATQADVSAIVLKRPNEIATANAIDPTTLATLTSNPTDAPAIAKAQSEIASAFKISKADAFTRLVALSSPAVKADLTKIKPYGDALQGAKAAIPASQLAVLNRYGTLLKTAQAGLPAPVLAKLTSDGIKTPHQWQHWWWVCFIAQIVFIPFIFLLAGRWSPKRARKDEEEHEAMVERELAELHQHAQA